MVCENHILHSVKATGLLTANQKFIIHFPITNHIRILTIKRSYQQYEPKTRTQFAIKNLASIALSKGLVIFFMSSIISVVQIASDIKVGVINSKHLHDLPACLGYL